MEWELTSGMAYTNEPRGVGAPASSDVAVVTKRVMDFALMVSWR